MAKALLTHEDHNSDYCEEHVNFYDKFANETAQTTQLLSSTHLVQTTKVRQLFFLDICIKLFSKQKVHGRDDKGPLLSLEGSHTP